MDIRKSNTWLGFALILLSLAVAIISTIIRDNLVAVFWMYVATIVWFVAGVYLMLNLSLTKMFGRAPVWNYTLTRGKLIIHYDCTLPVKLIGPSGKAILAVIKDSDTGKNLWIRDEESDGADLLVSGNIKNVEFNAGVLSITQQSKAGFRINWSEEENWTVN